MKKQELMCVVILLVLIVVASVLLTKFTSRETSSVTHLVQEELVLPINTEPIKDVGICKPYAYYGVSQSIKDPACRPEDLRCTVDPCR